MIDLRLVVGEISSKIQNNRLIKQMCHNYQWLFPTCSNKLQIVTISILVLHLTRFLLHLAKKLMHLATTWTCPDTLKTQVSNLFRWLGIGSDWELYMCSANISRLYSCNIYIFPNIYVTAPPIILYGWVLPSEFESSHYVLLLQVTAICEVLLTVNREPSVLASQLHIS